MPDIFLVTEKYILCVESTGNPWGRVATEYSVFMR